MKALSKPVTVRICGVEGVRAARVNGIYNPTDELNGGMPVYAKQGDAGTCLEYRSGVKKWFVKATQLKGTDEDWAQLESDRAVPPEQVRGSMWVVRDENLVWQHQPGVQVLSV